MLTTDAASSLIPPRSLGITVEEEEEDELGCMSSDSSQSNFSDSSSGDMDDDAASPTSPAEEEGRKVGRPLYGMSALATELPIKRGLSKYYDGKSRTFTSLSSVQCLEDLAKPERRPHRRKLKPCKSYGGGLDSSHHRAILSPSESSKAITKKASGGSPASSLDVGARRHSFIGGRPPVHPHRSNHFCGARTLLFA